MRIVYRLWEQGSEAYQYFAEQDGIQILGEYKGKHGEEYDNEFEDNMYEERVVNLRDLDPSFELDLAILDAARDFDDNDISVLVNKLWDRTEN